MDGFLSLLAVGVWCLVFGVWCLVDLFGVGGGGGALMNLTFIEAINYI